MLNLKWNLSLICVSCLAIALSALGQDKTSMPNTATRPMHNESAHQSHETTQPVDSPPLPEGMTLQEALDYAAKGHPPDFPPPIMDDPLRAYLIFQQLEYGVGNDVPDQLRWRAQAWVGYDYDKLWLRTEGSAVFEGDNSGETENDLLYARLITPFWYAQIGVQYANEWEDSDYTDRWSGVLAIQGVAPGMFEIESSLYLSDDADLTLRFEAEYDLRLTQRLVLQPRTEMRFAAQDIPDREIGAGMTNLDVELRLRYEIKREFAPYIGVGYHRIVGESAGLARVAGIDPEEIRVFAGLRLAF